MCKANLVFLSVGALRPIYNLFEGMLSGTQMEIVIGAVEKQQFLVGSHFLLVGTGRNGPSSSNAMTLVFGGPGQAGLETGQAFSEKVYVKINKVNSCIVKLKELSKCEYS